MDDCPRASAQATGGGDGGRRIGLEGGGTSTDLSREVILYTRKQCGLCDETADELRRLQGDLSFELTELDIDEDASLRDLYDEIVPVVAVGDRVVAHAPIAASELRDALSAALG
jgi:hypothetical protein